MTILTTCPCCGAEVDPGEVRQYDTGPPGAWTDIDVSDMPEGTGPCRVRATPIGWGCPHCAGIAKPND